MAPTYITVAGLHTNEGALITRERHASKDNTKYKPDGTPLLQTNMDCFRAASFSREHDWQDICNSRFRMGVAAAVLAQLGNCPTGEDLWALCSTHPCLAADTIYAVYMVPATGEYVTLVSPTATQKAAARLCLQSIVQSVEQNHKQHRSGRGGATRQ